MKKKGRREMFKLHHVGHVVKNYDEALKLYYKNMPWVPSPSGIMEIPTFGARIRFFNIGDIQIELISPGGLGGDPATTCLKERGEGLFHLGFYVKDFKAEIKRLREKGFQAKEIMFPPIGEAKQELRLTWLEPEETKGLWIELIDETTVPPLF
jgi:methylmalonyl-CoA/ethylmalonyl-CoA epimerase